jgi:chemotaxis regulatin CheY-phosphate phosphatase CheZ
VSAADTEADDNAEALAQFQMAAACREVHEALLAIRRSRESLRNFQVEGLRDTHAKLSEVSSTTETAATELLNGLDRTLALIDALEARSDPAGYEALRAEVNKLYGHLQFQDIIAQQLAGVGALLGLVEEHMTHVAAMLDDSNGDAPSLPGSSVHAAYNPDASMEHVSERQAAIDAAFLAARPHA